MSVLGGKRFSMLALTTYINLFDQVCLLNKSIREPLNYILQSTFLCTYCEVKGFCISSLRLRHLNTFPMGVRLLCFWRWVQATWHHQRCLSDFSTAHACLRVCLINCRAAQKKKKNPTWSHLKMALNNRLLGQIRSLFTYPFKIPVPAPLSWWPFYWIVVIFSWSKVGAMAANACP